MHGPRVPRLEVFSMYFKYKNSSSCSMESVREYPGDFKGQIFVTDAYSFHTIYDSKEVDSLYAPNQEKMQDSGYSQEISKRKMGDSFSGHTDVQDSEGFPKRAKRNRGDSTSGDTDLLLTGPNEEEVVQVSDGFPKSSVDSISEHIVNLPLIGPNEGTVLFDYFAVVVHKNIGNPEVDDAYASRAAPTYLGGNYVLPDDVAGWIACMPSNYDEPFEFHVDSDFRTLIMSCIVFRDSKVVYVEVKWLMPDNYICGELTVSSDDVLGKESFLIQTPQNKVLKVTQGEYIPLARSVVALPYGSAFTVKAILHDANNVSLVNSSVRFPFLSFFKKEPNNEYESKEFIDGNGGTIEVNVLVYVY